MAGMDKDGNLKVLIDKLQKTFEATALRCEVASCYNSRILPVLKSCYWLTAFTPTWQLEVFLVPPKQTQSRIGCSTKGDQQR